MTATDRIYITDDRVRQLRASCNPYHRQVLPANLAAVVRQRLQGTKRIDMVTVRVERLSWRLVYE